MCKHWCDSQCERMSFWYRWRPNPDLIFNDKILYHKKLYQENVFLSKKRCLSFGVSFYLNREGKRRMVNCYSWRVTKKTVVELNCFTIRGFFCGSSKGVSRMGGARPSRLMNTVVVDISVKLGTCLGETS